ncbi:MAG: HU family DNA-binding protein [Oscillospiraceae bacterium]|nr:HU family DNA-binding protein [Oscillospiraceae bacterium]
MPIKRAGFVERLNQKGYTKKDAAVITDDVFATVAEILIEGGTLALHGFGTFETVHYAAREISSVHGGTALSPARRVVKFKPGKLLRRMVSGVDASA